MKRLIYLDHAATTPIDQSVLAAMQPYFIDQAYNPSAQYEAARQVKRDITQARTTIASYFGSRPVELIFTAGGTEANNIAIHGIMQRFPDARIAVSNVEHDSVLLPAQQYNHDLILAGPDGVITPAAVEQAITDSTVLVSIQYANNEIGTLLPLKDISQLLERVREQRRTSGNELPLYFHTDACQAPAYLDIHVSRLGVDLMTVNGSKLYGPKQIGCLFIKSGVVLAPLLQGGGQERGLRSGTENVPAIIGFAAALKLAQDGRHDETQRLTDLREYFIDALLLLPGVTINGSRKHRLANNVHITVTGKDNETLMMQLDDRGVQCAVGSACSASNDEPSHVLMAIGLTDAEAQSSLRFTMGRATSRADIDYVVDCLKQLIK
jgi:cysteine desulfurase